MTPTDVVAHVERSWHELDGIVRGLDDEGLSLHRGPDGWAVKDHLVHVAAWEHWLIALFEGRDKLAAMGAGGAAKDMDKINDVVYRNHLDDSVHDALRYYRDAHEAVVAVLRKQSAEDLQRPYKTFFAPGAESDEQPVLVAVAANTYDHYDEHITWIREQLESPGSD
jgi:uncharacterized damage-inducible protein DinB